MGNSWSEDRRLKSTISYTTFYSQFRQNVANVSFHQDSSSDMEQMVLTMVQENPKLLMLHENVPVARLGHHEVDATGQNVPATIEEHILQGLCMNPLSTSDSLNRVIQQLITRLQDDESLWIIGKYPRAAQLFSSQMYNVTTSIRMYQLHHQYLQVATIVGKVALHDTFYDTKCNRLQEVFNLYQMYLDMTQHNHNGTRSSVLFDQKLTQEMLDLLKTQQKLERTLALPTGVLIGTSLIKTLQNLMMLHAVNQHALRLAVDCAEQFSVPPRQFWWILLRTFSRTNQWENIMTLIQFGRPPIGYVPIVEMMLDNQKQEDVLKLVPFIHDEDERNQVIALLVKEKEETDIPDLMLRLGLQSRRCIFVSTSRHAFFSSISLETMAVQSMATAFRQSGHLQADLDPLQLQPRRILPSLTAENFHPLFNRTLFSTDLTHVVSLSVTTGQQLYDELYRVYCGKIGFEFEYLTSQDEKKWLAHAIETLSLQDVTPSDLRNAYTSMLRADVFESFMGKKFASFKRYSGEGAESMLPAVETILQACTTSSITDVVIGMPHRGRLALLVGTLEYPVHQMFHKIRGYTDFPATYRGIDDVSSHIATTIDKKTCHGQVHVSLVPNPSHLEIINAVVAGKVRAKNDDEVTTHAMGLLLHGDAAFAGQGCVPEALSLSQLPEYQIGGTVHLIVNNQVGYTTTYPDNRTTQYASDIAKSIEAPVIHVNGESIVDVIRACRLAVAYRKTFHKDIVIDLITFRRHGHNEVDEPRFTQPKMYARVDQVTRFPIRFAHDLEKKGFVSRTSFEKTMKHFNDHLENELTIATSGYIPTSIDAFKGKWAKMKQPTIEIVYVNPLTGVEIENLIQVGLASVQLPKHIQPHGRLQRTHITARQKMLQIKEGESSGDLRVDWATAEAMAFGTLMQDGHSVRLAGQDCRRGTFSQRHAAFTDQETEELYFPLQHHLPKREEPVGKLSVVNSNLSELAVMGFEYGYSVESPYNLVIWEAQFGDFFNGAQIVIDQFLSSGESKWMRQSGLMLLLPHGNDGAGPDHSSGRIERFLQLVDSPALTPRHSMKDTGIDPIWKQYMHDTNMIVVNVSTPANFFHLLRRQQQRSFRKPVIIMGPKMLLRLADATSPLSEMGPNTSFQPVLSDPLITDASQVRKVYFCSGKFYYELAKERLLRCKNPQSIALIRVEELAPFPFEQIAHELASFQNAKQFVWVQEEPLNQGAWTYAQAHIEKLLGKKQHLDYIGRESLAAPAVGLSKRSQEQLEVLLAEAFGPQK
ncbi:putative 2-oxoglutarate dehydrogenase E1 component, thiamine diphosphate-binding protein [Plasmopara halstedii]